MAYTDIPRFTNGKTSSSSTFMNGDSEILPKRVDRTIKISAITKGFPLRRPNIKKNDSSLSSVSSYVKSDVSSKGYFCSNSTSTSSSSENDSLKISENEDLEKSLKPGLKTTLLDKFINKKEFPDFSSNSNNSIETADENLSLYSDKCSPYKQQKAANLGIKQRLTYPGKNVKFPSTKSSVHLDSDNLMDDNADLDPGLVECVNESTVEFVQKELFAKVVFAFTGSDEVFFDHPIGVAQLKNSEIVVADTFANKMHLISKNGEYIRGFGSNSILKQPSAIVVLSDGNFAVRNSRDITMFSPECSYLFSIGADYLRKPFGITADSDGNLITIDTGNSEFMTIVRIDAVTGNLTKKIPVIHNMPESLLRVSKPRFIAFRPPATLLVVDLGLNKVYIISLKNGVVLKSFGKSGSQDGEFNDPSGIVCDADGFILVGDSRNHRIQIFTPNGDFVSILRIDRPLRRPSGIYLTSDGFLLVLNYWENSLVKYQFSK